MTLAQFKIQFTPLADPASVVQIPSGQSAAVRLTVLTTRLIRMEYSPNGHFEDHASQAFWYRRQPVPPFQIKQGKNQIEIETEHLHLTYQINGKGFTPRTLSVTVKTTGKQWRFGDRVWRSENLRGTARTLDQTSGQVEIEPGLMARAGWAVVDDSQSLVFNDDCWLEGRTNPDNLDLYFFGYGHDYPACLADFCRLAGKTPLIPRWVLGNWWSRFWAYSQAELTGLMGEFRQHGVPLGVCIVDMDWHLIEPGETWSGWTGYTWNRRLFPDPAGFIAWLHAQGLKTALNLHPAEGINPHEESYEAMAQFMGVDPATREPILFDIADPRFTEGYFNILHHPYEAMGIDFWWLDWQQGTLSRLPGLDPLEWLNHLHFYDLGRDGSKRPFIFSRWGGLGNHRYPIGFSGDTIVSWESLALQPDFTASAANIGYGWWSHDIGGHMSGIEDDELYLRWIQFGVFSPILVMHCTKNAYHERRPWARGAQVAQPASEALRLRHALIPYIYSMAWRNYQQDLPLITPMYYTHPEADEAYLCPNQYWFGSELVAAPFIEPLNPELGMSRQRVWLPQGEWFDFFSGEHVTGGWHTVYGDLEKIPVFAKAGAIVPLGPQVGWGGLDNPSELTVHVFAGADNAFDLYEDDGETTRYQQGQFAVTRIQQRWNNGKSTRSEKSCSTLQFSIMPAKGELSCIPGERRYQIVFHGLYQPDQVSVMVNGAPHTLALLTTQLAGYDAIQESLVLEPIGLKPTDELNIQLSISTGSLLSRRDRRAENIRRMLRTFRLNTNVKSQIDHELPRLMNGEMDLFCFNELTDSQVNALKAQLER